MVRSESRIDAGSSRKSNNRKDYQLVAARLQYDLKESRIVSSLLLTTSLNPWHEDNGFECRGISSWSCESAIKLRVDPRRLGTVWWRFGAPARPFGTIQHVLARHGRPVHSCDQDDLSEYLWKTDRPLSNRVPPFFPCWVRKLLPTVSTTTEGRRW